GVLAAIRFEPSVTGEVIVEDDGGSKKAQPVDASKLRQREEQIARTAFDLAGVVHKAFAAALRLTPEKVAQVDRLEALGCDSLRIVEITVALTERFPWLPGTLLFEHRDVSSIVKEIVRLSQPRAEAARPARESERGDVPAPAATAD